MKMCKINLKKYEVQSVITSLAYELEIAKIIIQALFLLATVSTIMTLLLILGA